MHGERAVVLAARIVREVVALRRVRPGNRVVLKGEVAGRRTCASRLVSQVGLYASAHRLGLAHWHSPFFHRPMSRALIRSAVTVNPWGGSALAFKKLVNLETS